MRFFIGADIGGTFTDVILADSKDGRLYRSKVLTTPETPSQGVLAAIENALSQAQARLEDVDRVVHATTLATNLVLESKGARVAYIATKGFGDVIPIGREHRIEAERYDLLFEKTRPLVPTSLIAEVQERTNFSGEILEPLDEGKAKEVIQKLALKRPEAVAICLLHSYANRKHEQRLASLVKEIMPEVYIAASSEVWPEFREYERAMTTVISAYVGPTLAGYVEKLEKDLRAMGFSGSFRIMQSNGGVMSARAAAQKAVHTLESGPAAGVIATSYLSKLAGLPNVISFDMGGTTAKAGLIRGGKPQYTHDFRVGGKVSFGTRRIGTGFPVKTPAIDLSEVGAGGGSVAWVDKGGMLRVGPRSAGAEPGPACYGFGGDEPTVTDANLILGYLDSDYFLGGKMQISLEKALRAISHHVAEPLGMNPVEAAHGIYQIVNANMASAVSVVTVQRGIDPREFAVVAFGGAGPAHAVKVAEQFDIPVIVVPLSPGLTSALGLLACDMSLDYVRTRIVDSAAADPKELDEVFRELEMASLKDMQHEGIGPGQVILERGVDIRFRHQSHDLSVPVPSGPITAGTIKAAEDAFKNLYYELYEVRQDTATQIVNFRVKAIGVEPKVELVEARPGDGNAGRALKGIRKAFFEEANGFMDTRVYDREMLCSGDRVEGPAIIEEPDSTCVLAPGYSASVDSYLNLFIRRT